MVLILAKQNWKHKKIKKYLKCFDYYRYKEIKPSLKSVKRIKFYISPGKDWKANFCKKIAKDNTLSNDEFN